MLSQRHFLEIQDVEGRGMTSLKVGPLVGQVLNFNRVKYLFILVALVASSSSHREWLITFDRYNGSHPQPLARLILLGHITTRAFITVRGISLNLWKPLEMGFLSLFSDSPYDAFPYQSFR
jgi:hypothetical protein